MTVCGLIRFDHDCIIERKVYINLGLQRLLTKFEVQSIYIYNTPSVMM